MPNGILGVSQVSIDDEAWRCCVHWATWRRSQQAVGRNGVRAGPPPTRGTRSSGTDVPGRDPRWGPQVPRPAAVLRLPIAISHGKQVSTSTDAKCGLSSAFRL